MSLTRRALKAMGIEDDKIDEIIAAHVETVDAIKAERDAAVEKAGAADQLKKQLDEAEGMIKALEGDGWQAKYEQVHGEFEAYKAEQAEKARAAAKAEAYKEQVLAAARIDPKRIGAIMKVTDLGGVEIGEDGVIVGADDLKAKAAEEWADFVASERTVGASVPTPPTQGNAGGGNAEAQRIVAQRMAQYGIQQEQGK